MHDVSDGGIAISISEMTVGSSIGASIDLSPLGLRADFALFSEPQSSWIVEVRKDSEEKFMEILGEDAVLIGYTQENSFTVKAGEGNVMDVGIDKILSRWKKGYQ